MSRNKREGRYAGKWVGKHVRRAGMMPAIYVGKDILFDSYKPFADNGIAWWTTYERLKKSNENN